MKKQVRLVGVFMLMLLLFAGCGNQYADSEYVGTWQAIKAEKANVTVNVEDVYGVVRLTLDANGKATVVVGDDKTAARWRPEGKGVVIESAAMPLTLHKVKDNLACADYNGIKMYFEILEEE